MVAISLSSMCIHPWKSLSLSRSSTVMPFRVQKNPLSRVFELPTCGSKANMGLLALVLLTTFQLVSDQSHEANVTRTWLDRTSPGASARLIENDWDGTWHFSWIQRCVRTSGWMTRFHGPFVKCSSWRVTSRASRANEREKDEWLFWQKHVYALIWLSNLLLLESDH